MSKALKLVTTTLIALFAGGHNLLTGEPSDILASQFLILSISKNLQLFFHSVTLGFYYSQ
jgi:hypothetical protein